MTGLILSLIHATGVVLGVGGAVFAEIFTLRALRDGVVDPTESDFLKTTYRVLRVGMVLLIFSGFGFFLLYRLDGNTEYLYNVKYWVKMTFVVIILLNALLLQAKRIPFWLGSTLSITSWLGALVVSVIGRALTNASYLDIMVLYLLAIPVVALFLDFIHRSVMKKT